MNSIEIFNETKEDIKELEKIYEILQFAAKKEKLKNTTFNIIIVDNKYIHELNKNYRGIDKETDVITFALEDETEMINNSNIRVLGDIYISIEKAYSQKEEYGHSLLRELSFLAIHGFYHLLGYDHMTKEEEIIMFNKHEEVWDAYGIKRENKD